MTEMIKAVLMWLICWTGLMGWSASTAASDMQAQQVAALVSLSVYNIDTDELPSILRPYLARSENIKGLVIIDAQSGDRLFQFYRNEDGIVYNQNIPKNILKLDVYKEELVYNNELIGLVAVYTTGVDKAKPSTIFTLEEQKWLSQNRPVRYVFDPDWKPFEWKNAIGKHEGILADILDLVKEKSGLNLLAVPTDTWAESIQIFKNGGADMFSGIGVSNERSGYVQFTKWNIFSIPYVVVAKNTTGTPLSEGKGDKKEVPFAYLKSRSVGVVEGYAIESLLAEKSPNQIIVPSSSINEGLQSVMDGKTNYFVLNKVTAKSYLYQSKFKSLYLVGALEGVDLNLKLAIRKDWPPVVLSILDKTLATISDQKIIEIYQKWKPKPIDLIQKNSLDHAHLSFIVQVAGGFIAITVLTLFIFWLIKGRPKTFSIKYTLMFVFWVILAMTLTTAVLVSILLKSEASLQTWQKNNHDSIDLVQELRQSSDDLTRFVRMYVLTQDQKYKQYFQQVLDIRNGYVPHPENYSFSYWDEVLGGLRQIDRKGSIYNLKEKAQELEFTRIEIDLLTQAYMESESLAQIEQRVMNLIEGGKENLGDLDLEWARKQVFNQTYYEKKSRIMRTLSELEAVLTLRLNDYFEGIFMQQKAILSTIAVFVIMKIFFSFYAYSLLSRRVIKPLALFKRSAQKIQQGDYSQHIQLSTRDEMAQLANAFNGMIQGIASRTQEIQNNHRFTQSLLDSEEQMVVTLNPSGVIKSCNRAFLEFYNVTKLSEFIEQYRNISATFDVDALEGYLQSKIEGEHWSEYVIRHSSTPHYVQITRRGVTHIFSVTGANLPVFGEEFEAVKSAVFTDITLLEQQKKQTESVQKRLENMTNSIPGAVFQCQRVQNKYQMVFISQNIQTLQGVASLGILEDSDLFFKSILEDDRADVWKLFNTACDSLTPLQIEYRVQQDELTLAWIRLEATVSMVEEEGSLREVINGSLMDVTTEKQAKLELQRLHKHTRDSINYAALIQQAIIPDDALFLRYFSDYFTLWRPKDVVGGDIYLFEPLRNQDECLLMVIDCAGHGVPGAFVVMLVKAIEREIKALIMADPEMDVSPAWILSYFNKAMKMLLKQTHANSVSNAGFDGGVLYYNKKEKIIKFSGAESSLFYIEEGGLNIIKGNRHSVGYKKSDNNYRFKEHKILVKEGMQFYLATDGYFDQNGGVKSFPYGKKRFAKSLLQHADKTLKQQESFLIQSVETYQGDEEQNDDICMVGFKI